jgi:hypothetical protein
VKGFEVFGDEVVAVDGSARGSAAIEPDNRVHTLARLEVGKAPYLRDVLGGENAGADDQQQPLAGRNGIANLLVKGTQGRSGPWFCRQMAS